MKKLVFLFVTLLMLCSCNRMRVKHDHSRKVQSAHVPVDSAQKNYVDDVKDDSWKDEDVVVLPGEHEVSKKNSSESADSEIERMMKGEDLRED